jgi:hypothetical protein
MPYKMTMTTCADKCQHVSRMLGNNDFNSLQELESLVSQGFPLELLLDSQE